MIARELRAGPERSLADVRLFRELSGMPVAPLPEPHAAAAEARVAAADLAARLRGGELDAQLPDALSRLGEHVARKLEVARPGYDA